MKRQRFKFKLLAFFLFALFALLGTYGIHSIALYGNRWFTYAKNPRVRAQKQNVVPGDILDRSGVVLATSDLSTRIADIALRMLRLGVMVKLFFITDAPRGETLEMLEMLKLAGAIVMQIDPWQLENTDEKQS